MMAFCLGKHKEMLEKLHAIGYKPVLLLGKETKKKENKCEILTPRCTLSTYAQDYLQKIGSFYEYLCEGWNQDSSGNDDQLITLHLTPCDSLENTSSREEVRTTQVEETRNMLVEQVEQATIMEGQAEQMSVKEGQTEQVTIMEGQAERATIMEGQAEQMSTMEGQGSAMGTVDLTNKKKKSDTPGTHTGVDKNIDTPAFLSVNKCTTSPRNLLQL
ncbi:uncharacterized protein LOC131520522 [Onychostoma macrolepis]|uniref:uncharacterized protein LOC131520522 n=1 Tax=Onychostoma macrolepis TaxID=369639 RepID=UPI00272C5A94|nr:uncharacterized protein LOC131520522 [Onychostoma macrolepis]XP_058600794.1 uncharacterized protein LOC131520522 [Onychostoma macrolepis]XP_058600795.1 uncharacterized protein LOC131520522 [Onychostoma macrolepis]XP_058600796.1 uncharacterized protein LOC131520522 [Onychostoma macrolepis]